VSELDGSVGEAPAGQAPARAVWPRLLAAVLALAAGVVALVVVIELVRSTLG
jgi:hypothetical protein